MNLSSMRFSIQVLLVTVTLGGLVAVLIPDVAEAARGGGGARGGGASRSGPAASGSVRGSHSSDRRGRAGGGRDNRRNVGDNRRDARHDFRRDAVRRHRARHLTYGAFRALSCRSTIIIHQGVSYYGCAGTYYERVYQSGVVVYVIVAAPPGY